MTTPTPPSGDFTLKSDVYAKNGNYSSMSNSEYLQGRNNTGEVETPLGSCPNAQKENYMFRYLTAHIIYLTEMVENLDERVTALEPST